MVDFKSYREQFLVTQNYIYLNHAAVSPVSLRAAEKAKSCIDMVQKKGTADRTLWDEVDNVRQLAARLINADDSEIAFIKNTTEGINFVAQGLGWNEGDNIITADKEFPANVYPWLNLKKKGVELKFVEERGGRIQISELFDLVDEKTKLITISSVEFSSGFRNDLKKIGEFCRGKNIYFFVDAIQSLGALEIDVKEEKIDFLSADGHKWLLSFEGCGIFFIDERVIDDVKPAFLGWHSVEDPHNFLNYNQSPHKEAQKFEYGSLQIPLIWGLGGAIELLLEIGLEKIEERIIALTDYFYNKLIEKKCSVLSSRREGEKSGIISFLPKEEEPKEIYKKATEENIIISLRDNKLRVSPHFYNTKEELDEFLEII